MIEFYATFYTAGEYATREINAATAEEALRLARDLWESDPTSLHLCEYDDLQPLEVIRIDGPDMASCLEWQAPELTLANAASELLAALKKALEALNTAPRFKVPGLDTDSYAIAAICDEAIALAKGGAQ